MLLPSVLRQSLELRTLSQLTADELGALRQVLPGLHVRDIDNCHPSFLPWLAWQWRVDVWDDAWPESQKREVVKNALLLFRYRGTPWAVKRALALTGYQGDIIEWHQQTPEGPRGTFHVDVAAEGGRAIDQTFYEQVFALVENNKRGSQHWTLRPRLERKAGMYLPVIVSVCMKVTINGEGQNEKRS
jgi:phage tail P2-like protein